MLNNEMGCPFVCTNSKHALQLQCHPIFWFHQVTAILIWSMCIYCKVYMWSQFQCATAQHKMGNNYMITRHVVHVFQTTEKIYSFAFNMDK